MPIQRDNVKNSIKSFQEVSVDRFLLNMYILIDNLRDGKKDISSFQPWKLIYMRA